MSLTKVHNRMIDGSVANVLDFGADPTGSIDSQSAIQAAIDSGKPAYLPSGTYRVDSTLTIGTRGKGLIGASPIRRDYAAASKIVYQGAAGSQTPVILMGANAVGANPSVDCTSNVLQNLYIDCNDLAGFGVYAVSPGLGGEAKQGEAGGGARDDHDRLCREAALAVRDNLDVRAAHRKDARLRGASP